MLFMLQGADRNSVLRVGRGSGSLIFQGSPVELRSPHLGVNYETKRTFLTPLFSVIPLAKTPVAETGYASQRLIQFRLPVFF